MPLAIIVKPVVAQGVVPNDSDDDHVIAAAVAGEAGIIVSGDRHLLGLGTIQNIRIFTPTDALAAVAT